MALILLPAPGFARLPGVVAATNAERASGFADRADCEKALGGAGRVHSKAEDDGQASLRGSLFNRAAGNLSRCEQIEGEFQLVVYPAAGTQANSDPNNRPF